MQNEIETTEQTAARTLHKPAREGAEMNREQLVTYTDESGGGDHPGNGHPHDD
jgi:hypothetical protein